MSDIKLFQYDQQSATALTANAASFEKDLQFLLESNMETFLGVHFLATEYSTGKTHKGRIDSLGLDENGCPVIVEYKRHSNENVINQGLYYLDWLLDHTAEFKWLVLERLGKEAADKIEWRGTRLICIACDFNKYDEYAVQQINRNIELVRYRLFNGHLLLLELVNAQSMNADSSELPASASDVGKINQNNKKNRDDSQQARLKAASEPLCALYNQLCDFAFNLGDEVQRIELKQCTAFKKIKNFVSVVIYPSPKDPLIRLFLKLNPELIPPKEGVTRNVRGIGHWGTGDLEVSVRKSADFALGQQLIEQSYREN